MVFIQRKTLTTMKKNKLIYISLLDSQKSGLQNLGVQTNPNRHKFKITNFCGFHSISLRQFSTNNVSTPSISQILTSKHLRLLELLKMSIFMRFFHKYYNENKTNYNKKFSEFNFEISTEIKELINELPIIKNMEVIKEEFYQHMKYCHISLEDDVKNFFTFLDPLRYNALERLPSVVRNVYCFAVLTLVRLERLNTVLHDKVINFDVLMTFLEKDFLALADGMLADGIDTLVTEIPKTSKTFFFLAKKSLKKYIQIFEKILSEDAPCMAHRSMIAEILMSYDTFFDIFEIECLIQQAYRIATLDAHTQHTQQLAVIKTKFGTPYNAIQTLIFNNPSFHKIVNDPSQATGVFPKVSAQKTHNKPAPAVEKTSLFRVTRLWPVWFFIYKHLRGIYLFLKKHW